MISVKKDFDNPPEVLRNADQNSEDWKHDSVIAKLKELYHVKCAYCETKTEDLEIDHYRPKSLYPLLKNEWSNLLPICSECNKAKGAKFPIGGVRVSLESADINERKANSYLLLSEKPFIIHPEIDTAENHFYFEKNGVIQGFTDRGRKTVSVLNLHRNELNVKRRSIFDGIFQDLTEAIYQSEVCSGFPENIILGSEPQSPYSLFGLQIYKQFEDFMHDDIEQYISNNIYEIFIKIHKRNPEDEPELYNWGESFDVDSQLISFYEIAYGISEKELLAGFQKPINILNFSIKKFQGIEELQLKNIPINTQWIFLTGENGIGKTTLLRALLLGLVDKGEFEKNKFENSRIELRLVQDNARKFRLKNEWFDRTVYGRGIRDKFQTNICGSHIFESYLGKTTAAYGAKRTDLSDKIEPNVCDNLFEKVTTLFDFETRYKEWNIFPEKNKQKISNFELILKNVIPNLSRIDIDEDTSKVIYFEKQITTKNCRP